MGYDRLQSALGYVFRDPVLLEQALTHRSYSSANNERLEFLGDALLSAVVADTLYHQRARAEEGALSRLRASLVREETLALLARRLELGEWLRLGEGELKSGGWRRDSVLADALEAIFGAVYLDGGFSAVQACCLKLLAPELAQLPDPETLKDSKTRLQEWLQGRGRPLPQYEMLAETGPAHRRQFEVRLSLPDTGASADAVGSSRRIAEQRAAERMLVTLLEPDPAPDPEPGHPSHA